jgi:hypothetical protein
MASRKNQSQRRRRRGRKLSSSSSSSKRRRCKGGRGKRTEKKHNKWHQKGCQSGGGSVTGGWPWAPSDVHHTQTAGSAGVPQAINGNHYSLNKEPMAPPQNSNHLVERGQVGGAGTKKNRKSRGRRHRRFIGEQHGGMAQYLPEVANTTARSIVQMPAGAMNALQGASTPFRTSDPTIQPIGNAVQLA